MMTEMHYTTEKTQEYGCWLVVLVGWCWIFLMSNNNGNLFMVLKDGRFNNVITKWRML